MTISEISLSFALVLLLTIAAVYFMRMRLSRGPFGIVYDPQTHEVSFPRIRPPKPGPSSGIVAVGSGSYIVSGEHTWLERNRKFMRFLPMPDALYISLRRGDPRALALTDGGLAPAPYSAGVFQAALKSQIADRVLRGGLDWKIVVIIGLIAIVAILAVRVVR